MVRYEKTRDQTQYTGIGVAVGAGGGATIGVLIGGWAIGVGQVETNQRDAKEVRERGGDLVDFSDDLLVLEIRVRGAKSVGLAVCPLVCAKEHVSHDTSSLS